MSGSKSSRIARSTRWSAALLGVALGAAPAAAEVVVHDNRDGFFDWTASSDPLGGEQFIGAHLDITQPSTQSGERLPGTFGRWYTPNQTSSEAGFMSVRGAGGAQTARTTDKVLIDWNNITFLYRPTREYDFGEQVSAQDNWQFDSIYFFFLPWYDDFGHGTPAISTLAYLGVRVKISNEYHYGWILLEDYQKPVMWAYETMPNTPIQIPVPAPAGSLAVAMSLFATARHSRKCL